MRFYVLRHGRSPSAAEAGVRHDAERPISEAGRDEVRVMLRHLADAGGKPSIVFCSPLKRACQTAAEAETILKPAKGVRVFEPLANQMTGEMLFSHLLREGEAAGEFLAVGHQPQLGEMVAYLTGQIVELRPGGLVALETDAKGRASLLWFKNP